MYSHDRSKSHVDVEGPRNPVRHAMDTPTAQLAPLCGGRHGAIEGSGTLCANRAHSPRGFGDGAAVVAVSAAQKCGWLWRVSGGVIGDTPIGRSLKAVMCRSESDRFVIIPRFAKSNTDDRVFAGRD
jgi:hypothetical protein